MELSGLSKDVLEPIGVLGRLELQRQSSRNDSDAPGAGDLGSADAWYMMESSFNVPSAEPYIIRVRAEHAADDDKLQSSAWAYVDYPVKASC